MPRRSLSLPSQMFQILPHHFPRYPTGRDYKGAQTLRSYKARRAFASRATAFEAVNLELNMKSKIPLLSIEYVLTFRHVEIPGTFLRPQK